MFRKEVEKEYLEVYCKDLFAVLLCLKSFTSSVLPRSFSLIAAFSSFFCSPILVYLTSKRPLPLSFFIFFFFFISTPVGSSAFDRKQERDLDRFTYLQVNLMSFGKCSLPPPPRPCSGDGAMRKDLLARSLSLVHRNEAVDVTFASDKECDQLGQWIDAKWSVSM